MQTAKITTLNTDACSPLDMHRGTHAATTGLQLKEHVLLPHAWARPCCASLQTAFESIAVAEF